MPKTKKIAKNSRGKATKGRHALGGHQSMDENYSKLSDKFPQGGAPAQQAGSAIRQILDPCRSPLVSLPDGWGGRVEMVKSVHERDVTPADSNGPRHLIVNPHPTDAIQYSGTTTFATYVNVDDPLLANMTADYKFIRPVAMCVKVYKVSAATTDSGYIYGCNAPESDDRYKTWANVGEVENFLKQNGAMQLPGSDGFEIAWSPESQSDFSPLKPSEVGDNTDLDEAGRHLFHRPSINLLFQDMSADTKYHMTVTTVYECFLLDSRQYRGAPSADQSTQAMDTLMSVVKTVKKVSVGESIDSVGRYAAKVGGVVAGKAGRTVVNAGFGALRGAISALQ